MGNKLSHSACSKYLTCPEMYNLHYNKKLRPIGISSALLFGKAIDHAIEVLLNNGDYANAFLEKWDRQEINGQLEYLATHPDINYFKSDLDEGLLSVDDKAELMSQKPTNICDLEEAKSLLNQAAFKKVPRDVVVFYNYACWLSLRAKGLLMIDAYARDIKPRIKRVIAMQKPINLENTEGDTAVGFIDLIAEIDTGEVVVFDNKTSGRPYEEDKVKSSAQLALYSYAVEDEIPHTKCGYLVMIKKVQKEYKKSCSICGVVNESSHKTCPEKEGSKRCGGEFLLEPKFFCQTQFMVDDIPEQVKDSVVSNFNMINKAIKAEIYPKNFDKCLDIYGSPCPFLNVCRDNNYEGLHKDNKEESI